LPRNQVSVYGAWLVTPLGWKYAGIVWGYAFAWFLVTDPIKLIAYRVLDATKKAAPKRQAEVEPKAVAVKPDVAEKVEVKTAELKPDAAFGPHPDIKADDAAPEATKAAAAKPAAAKAAELKPDVKSSPEAEANAAYTKLMHTTLGDVLLAGLANDPHSVERIVAEAIAKAESAAKSRSQKRATPKPSRSLSRSPGLSRKPKPSPSRHPKPSPKNKLALTRRPK
jgi:H+-transporting ATPase